MQVQEPFVQLQYEGGSSLFVSMVDGAIGGLEEAIAAVGEGTVYSSMGKLSQIGEGLEKDKRFGAAANIYAASANILIRLGSPLNAANALINQGLAHKRDERPDLALHVYERAAAMMQEPFADPDEERERGMAMAMVQTNLAILHFQHGRRLEAAQSATVALQLARQRNDATAQALIRECTSILKDLNV